MTTLYSLPELADLLPIASVNWDIQRNDELSGLGDGRLWQAELAPPLWKADIGLEDGPHDRSKQIAAMIRALHGAQNSFWLYDPLSKYPQSDPKGQQLGNAQVIISATATDRTVMSLSGLPPHFLLTLGDKMQIVFGDKGQNSTFLEVSQTIKAAVNGATPAFKVFPALPTGIVAGLPVILIRAACRVVISPGSHNPGRAQGFITTGASLSVVEKKTL